MILLALAFGVLLIIPIGGADMPTVISILNAYAGLSAVAMGFVLDNKLLITAGALDGASGFILSIIMCRAMNRSFTNVLFGGFGQVQAAAAGGEQRPTRAKRSRTRPRSWSRRRSSSIIPGYGMAVAQAQHRVRELYDAAHEAGHHGEVRHSPGRRPHAGPHERPAGRGRDSLQRPGRDGRDQPRDAAVRRGPGHRRQRRRESGRPARQDSPIYGMPIIDADKAKTVFAIKRSMNPGFAGIDNELYFADQTFMLFGDAKAVVSDLVKQLGSNGQPH